MKLTHLAALALVVLGCQKPTSTEEPTTAAPPSTSSEPEATTAAPEEPPPAGGECKATGCSGTVCSDQDVVTTCEFKAEYACYRDATCTRQADGQCGWTQTPELDACLKNPPPVE